MKTPVIYISIIGTALVVGAAGGIVAKRILGGEVVQYGDFDPNSIEANSSQMLSAYESYTGNSPEKDFTPVQLINIGLEKYRQCEYSYSIGKGTAKTIVSQSIRNFQIKNGDEYMEESISMSSMVKLSNRMIQHGKDGDITLYKGEATGIESGTYPSNGVLYTQDEYVGTFGKTLDKMFIYIVSDSTYIEGDIKKDNDNYIVTVSLDPNFSTYHYKYQMLNISGLDYLPPFEYVKLTFTLDNSMTLRKMQVDEKYQASMSGLSVGITDYIEYDYYPNQIYKIPSLDENLDYSLKGE